MRPVTDDIASVGALAYYPVKSCAGITLDRAHVATTGLRVDGVGDREWMVVDDAGRFVTQRECARLSAMRVTPTDRGLALDAAGASRLDVARSTASVRDVVVWRDTVRGADAGDAAARWLSQVLGRAVRLVHFDAGQSRRCNPAWAGASGAHTMFSDGYPVLVIGRASLDELNRRLALRGVAPMAMARFRPNVVIDGLAPHDEDHLDTIEAPQATLQLVKPCTRCTITTIDPATGTAGAEPLATLGEYRMDPRMEGITFGMNAIVVREGPIAVGEPVKVRFRF